MPEINQRPTFFVGDKVKHPEHGIGWIMEAGRAERLSTNGHSYARFGGDDILVNAGDLERVGRPKCSHCKKPLPEGSNFRRARLNVRFVWICEECYQEHRRTMYVNCSVCGTELERNRAFTSARRPGAHFCERCFQNVSKVIVTIPTPKAKDIEELLKTFNPHNLKTKPLGARKAKATGTQEDYGITEILKAVGNDTFSSQPHFHGLKDRPEGPDIHLRWLGGEAYSQNKHLLALWREAFPQAKITVGDYDNINIITFGFSLSLRNSQLKKIIETVKKMAQGELAKQDNKEIDPRALEILKLKGVIKCAD